MSMILEERLSDSPAIDKVMYGRTIADNTVIRPAESHWYMVFSTRQGVTYPIVVGPWTSSGVVSWSSDAEILWVRFKLGTYMPQLPTKRLTNSEVILPGAAGKSFWLNSAAWQLPTYENVDTFINRLIREDVLICDPVVTSVLQDQQPEAPSRTVRHRFLQTTGLSQNRIYQLQRAQQAMDLLAQGRSILDVVDEAGYSDQPHLTRSLKHYIGYTPSQILQLAT